MRMRSEPFFTRPIGLNAAIADALFAQAQCEAGTASETKASAASARLQRAATSNPRGLRRKAASEEDIASSAYLATPLREGHCAPVTDGAVSMVLASGDWLKRNPKAKPLARIAGIGSAIDRYYLGGDRLAGLTSFKQACDSALRQANVQSAQAFGPWKPIARPPTTRSPMPPRWAWMSRRPSARPEAPLRKIRISAWD